MKKLSVIILSGMLLYACALTSTKKKTQNIQDENPKKIFNPHPSSAYLSPEESMKTFNLPPGYRLELVASEPMIKEPVAIAWDGNARMYVAEMLTYMQDANAIGEQLPVSRISLLEDTNGDGKMDKSTVFIDSLLLPRMILCVNNELLVNETNTITITAYKDTNGDGKADVKRIAYENPRYSANGANMEHQRSGLDWNLDNWIYMTYEPIRLKYTNGVLKADSIIMGSSDQWGLTHDNYGRLFYSSAGGEIPARRFQINPFYGGLDLPGQYDQDFVKVWPIISTPDVQGGTSRLRPDSTLNHFTASCGQSIFRGNALPHDLVGDYLVCEPVGRLIRRAKVSSVEGKTILKNAYHEQEFIASSDMNFRPVNTYTGPDGNLYIVDMHRGIIQQGNWTRPGSFLRKVIDRWGLAANVGRGRIYRLVHEDYKPKRSKPNMLNESPKQLLKHLEHENGWWRDNAQKQLVILGDKSVVPELIKMATSRKETSKKVTSPVSKVHALWTLEGLEAIDVQTLLVAMSDEDEQVRKAAVWISEPFIKEGNAEILKKLTEMKADSSYEVKTQLLLSLRVSKNEDAMKIADELMVGNQNNTTLVAVQKAVDRNENIRDYGHRLANLAKPDRERVLQGAAIYRSLCATCHGGDGKGLEAEVAPVLAGSKRLGEDKATAIRILLHGLTGPIEGKQYPGDLMVPMGANTDEWIASVLSYARFEFAPSKKKEPVSPFITAEEVKKIRDFTGERTEPWTIEELEAINSANEPKAPEEERFSKTSLVKGQLVEPTEMAILPNLDILIAQHRGELMMYSQEKKKLSQVGFLKVYDKTETGENVEEGFMGLAIDPDFKNNQFVYAFYSPVDTSVNRLSRFKFKNNKLDLASEKVILELYSQRNICCHTGGSIAFGKDRTLFLSTGDNTYPANEKGQKYGSDGYAPIDDRPGHEQIDAGRSSGNSNDLRGKILRIKIKTDGSYEIPDGNLFPKGLAKTRPEIYVMGNRNPYRISIDKKTDFLYWGEVGPDAGGDNLENRGPRGYDEINQARKAGFFGWPFFIANNYAYYNYNYETGVKGERFDVNKPINNSKNNTGIKVLPPAQPAFIWYPYNDSKDFPEVGSGGRTAMAGPVYHPEFYSKESRYPDYYANKLFIYDWVRGWIKVVTMEPNGDYDKMEPFMPHTKFAAPMDMEVGPDGKIYVLEYGNGWYTKNEDAGLSRIDYFGGELSAKNAIKKTETATKKSSDTSFKNMDKAITDLGQKKVAVPKGKSIMLTLDCQACHSETKKSIGPTYKDVAKRYKNNKNAVSILSQKIIKGGAGVWGQVPMAAHPSLKEADAKEIVRWILTL